VRQQQVTARRISACAPMPPPGLSEDDAFLMDLNGFLVIRDALSLEQVDRLNAAIDHHSHLIEESVSLADGPDSAALRGAHSVVAKLRHCLRERLPGDEVQRQLTALRFPPQHGKAPVPVGPRKHMRSMRGHATSGELRSALGSMALSCGRAAMTPVEVDDFVAGCQPDADGLFSLGTTRGNLGGPSPLRWSQPHCQPFRELIVNPVVKPCLEAVLGPKFRLENGPHLLTMHQGSDGHTLHGGGFDRFSADGMAEAYTFQADTMRAGMVVAEFMLADEGPGDGGLAVVCGS
jgi:hypothetical protein